MKKRTNNQMYLHVKLKLIILIIALSSVQFLAQNKGSFSGILTDESNNETLIGANVLIVGTSLGASTDLDGVFFVKGIPAGKYTVKFSFISYQTITVENVKIEEGKETKLNISLKPTTTEIGEVVITAELIKSTEGALLTIQKNSLSIVDGLSAELIGKNNSSDGTDILTRMTGVTISEGKFAFVRGIGDRYNNTMLNGANLPSTDPEKKSFSYDIFPASLIENILTSKTFTPDKPADFSGGLVEINTVEFPARFLLDVSTAGSYNTVSSMEDFLTYNGGKSDYLGMDDGTRDIPSTINNTTVLRGNYSQDQLKEIGKSFSNTWKTKNITAPLNSSFKINVGDRYNIGDNIFGYIASLTYSNSAKSGQMEKNNYTFEGPRYIYKGNNYTKSVMWGALLNLSYKFDQNHKISLKNIYNQSSDDETINYQGAYYYNPDYRNVTSLRYVSRSLISSQVIGEHHLDVMNGLNIDWNINYAHSKRNEPDARRYVYVRDLEDTEADLMFQLDQSLATRFFGNLEDQNIGAGVNFLIKPFESPEMPAIKFGFLYDKKDRDFNARTFGFKNVPGGNFAMEQELLTHSIDEIFAAENFGNNFIEITEITKPTDSYTSYQNVTGTYLMTDFRLFEKLKVVTGVRYEHSVQHLESKSLTGAPIKIEPTYDDFLPSLNLTYSINEKMNLRAAFTKTLARPEFRELAPFTYFDFLANENVEGNINLKRAIVTNYDLRYEYYPSAGELLAVGLFYKSFKDPIEEVLISSSGFEPTRSFQNADKANNYGLEIELRKSFLFISSSLDGLSFVGNLSLIKSEIEILSNGFQESTRPLQGQADYIINLGLYYDDNFSGFSTSLIYNKVGERISKVGFNNLGDIIEKPRDQIDFSISKKIFENFNIKLTVKDLLAQDRKFMQKSPNGDKIAEKIKVGRDVSLGINYTL
ncbi:MAG: TonB-dependent receptor [bacterium]